MVEIVSGLAINLLIDEIMSFLRSRIKQIKKTGVVAVAMFDLPGSTKLKITLGHSEGTRLVLEHNLICEKISNKYEGIIIKHMGDGVFIKFKNPIKACLAAMMIKRATLEDGRFSTKGGITFGVVESIDIGGTPDLIGTTIDRCARLSSMAIPGQILIFLYIQLFVLYHISSMVLPL